jgi:hypothetical protein
MKIEKEYYEIIKEKWKPFLVGIPTDEQFDCSFILNTLENFMFWEKIDENTFLSFLEKILNIFRNVNTENHYEEVLDILEESEFIKNKFNREDAEDKHLNFLLALCGDADTLQEYFVFLEKNLQNTLKKLKT